MNTKYNEFLKNDALFWRKSIVISLSQYFCQRWSCFSPPVFLETRMIFFYRLLISGTQAGGRAGAFEESVGDTCVAGRVAAAVAELSKSSDGVPVCRAQRFQLDAARRPAGDPPAPDPREPDGFQVPHIWCVSLNNLQQFQPPGLRTVRIRNKTGLKTAVCVVFLPSFQREFALEGWIYETNHEENKEIWKCKYYEGKKKSILKSRKEKNHKSTNYWIMIYFKW